MTQGIVMFRAGASITRHLSADCRYLRRAKNVARRREVGLWPGFVCDACRDEATCPTCSRVWPYCDCRPVSERVADHERTQETG